MDEFIDARVRCLAGQVSLAKPEHEVPRIPNQAPAGLEWRLLHWGPFIQLRRASSHDAQFSYQARPESATLPLDRFLLEAKGRLLKPLSPG